MAHYTLDKKLEGRLFELLEVRARIPLGRLVQLRRRSREMHCTLLQAAGEAGQVDEALAHEIEIDSGLAEPPMVDVAELIDDGETAEFDALPNIDGELSVSESDIELETGIEGGLDPALDGVDPTDPARHIPTETLESLDLAEFEELELIAIEEASESEPASRDGKSDGAPEAGDVKPVASRSGAGSPWTIDTLTTEDLEALRAAERQAGRAEPDIRAESLGKRGNHKAGFVEVGRGPAEAGAGAGAGAGVGVIGPLLELEDDSIDDEATLLIDSSKGSATPTRGSVTVDTEPPEGSIPGVDREAEVILADAGCRYELGTELGRGGMGEVLEARELSLGRTVAIKLLLDQDDPSMQVRFIDEARVTGQLQHPGVPPTYELGRLDDGRVFFAMRRIRGRTLRAVLEDLRAHDSDTEKSHGRVRLLMVFAQVCRTIAYAHSRRIIHRDLKPDNIMLGGFGEVTVMDWGLAKPFGNGEDAAAIATQRSRSDGRFSTLTGEITGTPQYMPPEQAAGRIAELGSWSDIYSLGALLYELLTLEPPFDGPTSRAIQKAVVEAPLVPPSARAPHRAIPPVIEALCLECLAKDPEERPASAASIADRIDTFLEGEQERARKAAERDRLVAIGQQAATAYYDDYNRYQQLQKKTAILRTRLDPWAPLAQRRVLWGQEDAEAEARRQAARRLSEALAAYQGALAFVDGDHAPTRAALAELYYSAFLQAERATDATGMTHYDALTRAFDDDGTYSRRLKGDGRLEIETLPRGLKASLHRLKVVDRMWVPGDPQPLDHLPVRLDPVPMGSYLLRIHAPGLSDSQVPVHVSRQECVRLRLRLFPDSVIGEGFVHVAGGPTRLGGDPQAQLARPPRTVEIGDFFISRRPISAKEYLQFLRMVMEREGLEPALARAPRASTNGPPLWPLDSDRRPTLPERDERGLPWEPEWPVVNISALDAEAYCDWMTEYVGHRHRLPSQAEWEKAARGADGRLFPWGDAWESGFCHMGISRLGPPERGRCGEFETDVSPYGVIDLAGGVTDWTSTWLDEGSGQRIIKGGNWASGPTECRAASRFTQPANQVLPTVGFRVVREAPS